jgi:hypothetical protein
LIAVSDTLGHPRADFRVTPRDAASAELNPQGEASLLFEPRDVLEAVRDA